MGIIKRYPVLFAVLGFLFLTLPDAVNNWFSLAERFKQAEGIVWQLILTDWVFPILGLVLLIVVIRQRGGVKPPLFPENGMASWLEQTPEDDKTHIGNRIYTRDYVWDFKGLKEPDAFIELSFTLINAVVFPINITGIVGRFSIEEHECAQAVEYIGTKRIPHGDKGGIRIKQRLTREMADLIINRRDLIPHSRMDIAKKGKIKISLKTCQITIIPEITGELAKPIQLGIGGDYEVSIS